MLMSRMKAVTNPFGKGYRGYYFRNCHRIDFDRFPRNSELGNKADEIGHSELINQLPFHSKILSELVLHTYFHLTNSDRTQAYDSNLAWVVLLKPYQILC